MSLTTTELNTVLFGNNVTSRYFIGTFPACEIPFSKKHIYCFITNTDEHDKSADHWNSWFIRNKKLIFFDSFGRDPRDSSFPHYYKDMIRKFGVIEYTTIPIQRLTSATCGLFCIHFIYVMSLGLDIVNFCSDYYFDTNLNDCVVLDFISSIQ